MFVPLLYQGRVLGVLNAFDRFEDGPEFDRDDEQVMESFAASAAVAVVTAQEATSNALRRSIEATERERARWARERHDETLQELAALSIRLSAARDQPDFEAVREEIDDAVRQASTAARGLRDLITDLRPAALDQLGVQPALEALVERLRASAGIDVELHADLDYEAGRQPMRLAPDIESVAYRLVQEALNNVTKHAGVDRAEVDLAEADGRLTVVVRDAGAGFSPGETGAGFGLIGMRERIALVHGDLNITSSPGSGTTIRATLPTRRVGDAPDEVAATPLMPRPSAYGA
jgi:signal transduction histidine kinase